MRVNRRLRGLATKPGGLWPPPATNELCRAAVAVASIAEIVEARDRLRFTPDGDKWARCGLGSAIADELQRRFRERLEVGLAKDEIRPWGEILEDPDGVGWHIARMTARTGHNVHVLGSSDDKGGRHAAD